MMPFKHQHPLYNVWQSMKERCRNPNGKMWHRYGGRGITVCERWLGRSGFDNFVADMGPRPDGLSLDRIDNDKGYSPDNCRWATRKEQQWNLSNCRDITVEGLTFKAAELAFIYGFKVDTIVKRAETAKTFAELVDRKKKVFTAGLALGGKASGANKRAKTHCPQGHPYSGDNLVISKEGYRACQACHRDRQRIRNRKLAALAKQASA